MREFIADFSFRRYVKIYGGYYDQFWDSMGPMEYGFLLIAVALAGIFLMKSSR